MCDVIIRNKYILRVNFFSNKLLQVTPNSLGRKYGQEDLREKHLRKCEGGDKL